MLNGLLQQMIDTVSSLAPQIWMIYVRQNYVYATWDLMAAIVGAVIIFVGVTIIRRGFSNDDFDSELGGSLIVLIGTMAYVICLGSAIARGLNPYYYAIQDIMRAFKIN